jgi:hypothetical protein
VRATPRAGQLPFPATEPLHWRGRSQHAAVGEQIREEPPGRWNAANGKQLGNLRECDVEIPGARVHSTRIAGSGP